MAEPAVANAGLLRPPFVYLGSMLVGLAIHAFWTVAVVPPAFALPTGVTALLAAVALFVSAVRRFRAAGTPVPGDQPASAIVRSGPYRFTRNPIYLAFTLCHLGIALWVNSAAMLVMLALPVALMSLVVIPREERYLEAKFPAEYPAYKASVRRWL